MKAVGKAFTGSDVEKGVLGSSPDLQITLILAYEVPPMGANLEKNRTWKKTVKWHGSFVLGRWNRSLGENKLRSVSRMRDLWL